MPGIPRERPADRLGRYAPQSSTSVSGASSRSVGNRPASDLADGAGTGAVFETSTMTNVIQEVVVPC